MKTIRFTCPKCGHNQHELGEIYAAGSMLTKIFNIQNRKFTSISCKRCTYTELYKTEMKKISNVFDFLVG
ncbi:MAG: zinc ribbon domain-containing protein [Bacteroidetes bacterium]|nr:zinc ribbon domain-containing protein [Bacteroidota bacterium]